jgi:hypothetical protein
MKTISNDLSRKWLQGNKSITPASIINDIENDSKILKNTEKAYKPLPAPDKLSKMLRDAPKAEKVGMALYGMQGLNPRYDSVRILMDILCPFVRNMPSPSGKILGMALQGFKACGGRVTGSHAEVVSIIAKKLPGWAGKGKDVGSVYASDEIQVTLRSALWGVSKLDRQTLPVRFVVICLCYHCHYHHHYYHHHRHYHHHHHQHQHQHRHHPLPLHHRTL